MGQRAEASEGGGGGSEAASGAASAAASAGGDGAAPHPASECTVGQHTRPAIGQKTKHQVQTAEANR